MIIPARLGHTGMIICSGATARSVLVTGRPGRGPPARAAGPGAAVSESSWHARQVTVICQWVTVP